MLFLYSEEGRGAVDPFLEASEERSEEVIRLVHIVHQPFIVLLYELKRHLDAGILFGVLYGVIDLFHDLFDQLGRRVLAVQDG